MSEIDWSKAPEGATHKAKHGAFFKLDVSGVFIYGNGKWEKLNWASWQIEKFDERPTEWSGDGLPPVGTVCEGLDGCNRWHKCRIVHHSIGVVPRALAATGDDESGLGMFLAFRPIRTPEQIAADERLHKIRNACTAIHSTLDDLRGSTKIERAALRVVEAMIDAGYAKAQGGGA